MTPKNSLSTTCIPIHVLFYCIIFKGVPLEDDKEEAPKEPQPGPIHPPILITTDDGELGIPLAVFDYVADVHMPYNSKVGQKYYWSVRKCMHHH